MDVVDDLIKCRLCQANMKDPRILTCQHTFCYVCLKDRADKGTEEELKCPTCFEKFELKVVDAKKNDFVNLRLNLKTCGMCKKSEAEEYCEACDQAFCLSCVEVHNKMKVSKDHDLVRLSGGEQQFKSEQSQFCVDCDKFIDSKSIDSHKKHELTNKENEIEKRLLKWKEEVRKITECREEYRKSLITEEEKWSDEKEKLMKIKSLLEENYKEFMEFLQQKKNFECCKVDALIDKIEERIIKYKEQFKNCSSTLEQDGRAIRKRMEQMKRGSEEVLNDKSIYKLPRLQPPPYLPNFFVFKRSSTDALCNILPSIKLGQYEQEGEKVFKEEGCDVCRPEDNKLYLDEKYLHVCYGNKIGVHSLDTLQPLQTLQCPEGFQASDVVCVKKRFFVTSLTENKLLIFDENGILLSQALLPSNGSSLKISRSDKVLITSGLNTTVFSYDVETKKLETVPTPSVQWIYQCCSMGGDAYCMDVAINGCRKIIKCVQGSIIKSYDVASDITDILLKDGEWLYVLEGKKKKVHILDGDLQLVSSVSVDSTQQLERLSVDAEWNMHLLSDHCIRYDTKAFITKYRLQS